MKILKTIGLALAAAGALSLPVQATSITGNIKMGGTVTLNNMSLGSATAATSFDSVVVGGTPTGSFVGTDGNAVTWVGFAFGSSADVSPLWTFTDPDNLWTYSFSLDNNFIVSQDNFFLSLRGTGTLDIVGAGDPYDATAGTWSFTITNDTGEASPNFEFTFANSQTAVIPDGGATAMLLGVGLLGLGALR